MRAGYFIAGTDTGVGKTRVTTGLITAFQELNLRVVGMKPVSAGFIDDDADTIATVSGQKTSDLSLNPYHLPEPISPNIAAKHAGIVIELEAIRRHFLALCQNSDLVVVEGAGGWLTPISDHHSMADVAAALELPVILTVALRLGCQSHALLTAQAIRQQGLSLAGWIGNRVDPAFLAATENIETLAARLGSAPLALLPCAEDARSALPALRSAAATLSARLHSES